MPEMANNAANEHSIDCNGIYPVAYSAVSAVL